MWIMARGTIYQPVMLGSLTVMIKQRQAPACLHVLGMLTQGMAVGCQDLVFCQPGLLVTILAQHFDGHLARSVATRPQGIALGIVHGVAIAAHVLVRVRDLYRLVSLLLLALLELTYVVFAQHDRSLVDMTILAELAVITLRDTQKTAVAIAFELFRIGRRR